MIRQTRVLICSAELDKLSETENKEATKYLRAFLEVHKIPYKEAIGVYKGAQEKSFVVVETKPDTFERIKRICFRDLKQEAVLIKDSDGHARLETESGDEVFLGRFGQISREEAEEAPHTRVGDKYYGIL